MAENRQLTDVEIDAIGEILNISMGSAATAVSNMLDKQVSITTPVVTVKKLNTIDYSALEPAIGVKITYVEGLDGANVMVFKQLDMQLILNQLMGITDPIDDTVEFQFDELSTSAACEVMNQMMGASATALSQFLNRTVNISTPSTHYLDEPDSFSKVVGIDGEDDVVSINFQLTIKDIMDSKFVSVMTYDLAKTICGQFLTEEGAEPVASPPPPPPTPPVTPPPAVATPVAPTPPPVAPPAPSAVISSQTQGPPVAVQQPQFPNFVNAPAPEPMAEFSNNNMGLLMNVPLNVSVEIGKTRRKIKDILDFTSGTVIELEKQAGAPVDIVVNGQLIAKGDVVVVEDNFGVRVTEILDAKTILNTIGYNN